MKVTRDNNQRMIGVNILNIFLFLVLLAIWIYRIHINHGVQYGLSVISEATYTVLIFYLINILQFAGEKILVQTPFSIYLGLQLISFISSFFSRIGLDLFSIGLGVLNFLVIIFIVISAFKVKNEKLSFSFKTLGLCIVLPVILRVGLPLIPSFSELVYKAAKQGVSLIGYINLSEMIPLFAILYTLIQTGKILTEREPSSAVEFPAD